MIWLRPSRLKMPLALSRDMTRDSVSGLSPI
jgi:hypothetical protein